MIIVFTRCSDATCKRDKFGAGTTRITRQSRFVAKQARNDKVYRDLCAGDGHCSHDRCLIVDLTTARPADLFVRLGACR
jgi:hypothetical protein